MLHLTVLVLLLVGRVLGDVFTNPISLLDLFTANLEIIRLVETSPLSSFGPFRQ